MTSRRFEDWLRAGLIEKSMTPLSISKANFDPNEPRNDRSWWINIASDLDRSASIQNVQYRGYYHDAFVDTLHSALTSEGSQVLRGVKVAGFDGVVAIPDLMSKPAGTAFPYFIEVKTGNDPRFTAGQADLYKLICLGGHVTSFDPRIERMGLKVGVPFPPMDILLVVTGGPGQKVYYDSYCAYVRAAR